MKLTNLKIGILHSLIGKNDGVSIVIDQSIKAMIQYMDISLDNLYFVAGHSSPRFNTILDNIFWHKNEINKYILQHYSSKRVPRDFEDKIIENATIAKNIIRDWVNENDLDLIIAHNSCHPSNFVYAVGLCMFFEEIRQQRKIRPRYLLWWHDSHYERDRFSNPNSIIARYQKYIPGPHVDGVIIINSKQEEFVKHYYKDVKGDEGADLFFNKKVMLVPNTCDVPSDWDKKAKDGKFYPEIDQFNTSFLKDTGILRLIKREHFEVDDTVFFLQHTRIVQRKKIEHAIDFVFKMAEKYEEKKQDKLLLLIVSGHGRDEHDKYHKFLDKYFKEKKEEYIKKGKKYNVFLKFIEDRVMPEREILVEKKFYKFEDIPGIISNLGGMGTYFSEVEGFGNNLLEMISYGLPVAINRYPVYETDIKHINFKLPSTKDGKITKKLVNESYELLNDNKKREQVVKHNLKMLRKRLNHGVIGEKLSILMKNIFTYH